MKSLEEFRRVTSIRLYARDRVFGLLNNLDDDLSLLEELNLMYLLNDVTEEMRDFITVVLIKLGVTNELLANTLQKEDKTVILHTLVHGINNIGWLETCEFVEELYKTIKDAK